MEVSAKAIGRNKLTILYLLKDVNMAITDNQILYTVTKLELMDYFDLVNSLVSLKETKLVEYSEQSNGYFYKINEHGEEALGFYQRDLPYSTRMKISEFVKDNKETFSLEAMTYAEYHQVDKNKFRVILKVLENTLPVFEIMLFAHTRLEADNMAKIWRKKALEIYRNTLESLY